MKEPFCQALSERGLVRVSLSDVNDKTSGVYLEKVVKDMTTKPHKEGDSVCLGQRRPLFSSFSSTYQQSVLVLAMKPIFSQL